MQNKKPFSIIVCGAGSLGSNLAVALASDSGGGWNITVLDYDKIEERNIQVHTQYYRREQIGWPKVQALQLNIKHWCEKKIEIIEEMLTSKNLSILDGYDLYVDCFDNREARQLIQDYCSINKKPVVHLGFSPQFTFEIAYGERYKVPDDSSLKGFDICEAENASSFIKMVASLGSLVIQDYIRNGKRREVIGNRFNIREIK